MPTRRELGAIRVVSVGGGGVHILAHVRKIAVPGVECIAMHSVAKDLAKSNAHRTFLLGRSGERTSRASGARVDAEDAANDVRQVLSGARLVLLLSAFGGAVGTGASPVIARTSRQLGIPTIALVSMPFNWDTFVPKTIAAAGVELISRSVDMLIVVSSDSAMDMLGNSELDMEGTVDGVNHMIATAAADVLKIFGAASPLSQTEGLIFGSLIGTTEMALLGSGVAAGVGRARIAAERAVSCPLLEGVALLEADKALVLITTAPGSLASEEPDVVMDLVRRAAPSARCWCSLSTDPLLADDIRVTVVGVGLQRNWKPQNCGSNPIAKRLPDAPVPEL